MGVLEPDKEREVRIDPALMKLLASDTRRNVLRKLGKRAMTLSELSRALELKKATILEHLRRLEDAELIHRREDDRLWIYYELTPRARSLVDPVGTRLMIVLGVTVFALVVGALIALFAQPYFAPTGGDDAQEAFFVDLEESEVSSASAFTLSGTMSQNAGSGGLSAYLLDAEQAQRIREGQSWTPMRQLEPDVAGASFTVSGPRDVPPGTYHLLVVQGDGDNRDSMPLVHVRPLQVDLSHTVWWHGLDDNLSVTLADLPVDDGEDQGWLLVTPPGAQRDPLLLPVSDQSATIPFQDLDRLGPGIHKLHYLYPDDERMVALPDDFRVLEASMQVLPPILLEGEGREIHTLLHADSAARPTQVPVHVNGTTLASDLASPSRGVVRVPDVQPGELTVQVGRHHNETLTVIPDLRVDVALEDGPRLRFSVTGNDNEPRQGVQVRLGGILLGTTNGDGEFLRTSPPPQGPALLQLTTPEGHATGWGVDVADWEIKNRPTSLHLENFTRTDFEVDVSNLEDWPVTATLVTTVDEDVIGATAVALDGNEAQRVQVRAAEADTRGSLWAVHAEGPPLQPVAFRDVTTPQSGGGGGGGASPTPTDTEEPTYSDAEPTPEAEPLFGNRIAKSEIWSPPPTSDDGMMEEPTDAETADPTDLPDDADATGDDDHEEDEEATPGLVAVVPVVVVLGIVVVVRWRLKRWEY